MSRRSRLAGTAQAEACGYSLRCICGIRRTMAAVHVREKPHRLPRAVYRGAITAAFTARIAGRQRPFPDPAVVGVASDLLRAAAEKHQCAVLIYCFIPDHVHLIVQGQSSAADLWQTMTAFKQQSGYWFGRHRPSVRWQKDFYDHVVRASEDLRAQVRYVADNPVRKGLAQEWQLYPFTGAIGIDLADLLESQL